MKKKSFAVIAAFSLLQFSCVGCFAGQTIISAPGVEIRTDGISAPGVEINTREGTIVAPGVEISPWGIEAPGVEVTLPKTEGDIVFSDDDTIVNIASAGQNMYVSGDENTITVSGEIAVLEVNGDDNVIEIENITQSIICNGDGNQLIFPENDKIKIVNTGFDNRLHSRRYSAVR